ncbi:hypothetical protein BY996DRAFT_6533354 [Phakopsora pachyrhizi]|nr:hypothetical protein BY996DRAFT_6533354 [Phakopsora pachyrhizi]
MRIAEESRYIEKVSTNQERLPFRDRVATRASKRQADYKNPLWASEQTLLMTRRKQIDNADLRGRRGLELKIRRRELRKRLVVLKIQEKMQKTKRWAAVFQICFDRRAGMRRLMCDEVLRDYRNPGHVPLDVMVRLCVNAVDETGLWPLGMEGEVSFVRPEARTVRAAGYGRRGRRTKDIIEPGGTGGSETKQEGTSETIGYEIDRTKCLVGGGRRRGTIESAWRIDNFLDEGDQDVNIKEMFSDRVQMLREEEWNHLIGIDWVYGVREVLECSVSVYELLVTSKQLECQHFRRFPAFTLLVTVAPVTAAVKILESRLVERLVDMLDAPETGWARGLKVATRKENERKDFVGSMIIKQGYGMYNGAYYRRYEYNVDVQDDETDDIGISLTAKEAGPMVFTPRQEKGLIIVWKIGGRQAWMVIEEIHR